MALLHSEKKPLGSPAPDFNLKSVEGKNYSLQSFSPSRILVMMFICSHCPYVKAIEDRILELAKDFPSQEVQFVGICSNDPTDYPEDSPANLLKRWKDKAYGFPYLIDAGQEIAKAYGAVCTPDLFVFDSARKLAYHGQLDDSWQDPGKVTRRDMKDALVSLLDGKAPADPQIPSMGCSIKWSKP